MGCDVKLLVRLVPVFCYLKIQAVFLSETTVPTYRTAESIAYFAEIVGYTADSFVSLHAL